MGEYKNITKDRYRVIEQINTLLGYNDASLNMRSNIELSGIWLDIKGYELRYVGDDLFQCVEYK